MCDVLPATMLLLSPRRAQREARAHEGIPHNGGILRLGTHEASRIRGVPGMAQQLSAIPRGHGAPSEPAAHPYADRQELRLDSVERRMGRAPAVASRAACCVTSSSSLALRREVDLLGTALRPVRMVAPYPTELDTLPQACNLGGVTHKHLSLWLYTTGTGHAEALTIARVKNIFRLNSPGA
jgi:hypothetical protein